MIVLWKFPKGVKFCKAFVQSVRTLATNAHMIVVVAARSYLDVRPKLDLPHNPCSLNATLARRYLDAWFMRPCGIHPNREDFMCFSVQSPFNLLYTYKRIPSAHNLRSIFHLLSYFFNLLYLLFYQIENFKHPQKIGLKMGFISSICQNISPFYYFYFEYFI